MISLHLCGICQLNNNLRFQVPCRNPTYDICDAGHMIYVTTELWGRLDGFLCAKCPASIARSIKWFPRLSPQRDTLWVSVVYIVGFLCKHAPKLRVGERAQWQVGILIKESVLVFKEFFFPVVYLVQGKKLAKQLYSSSPGVLIAG